MSRAVHVITLDQTRMSFWQRAPCDICEAYGRHPRNKGACRNWGRLCCRRGHGPLRLGQRVWTYIQHSGRRAHYCLSCARQVHLL